jgi:hypothetical protein
MEHMILPDLDFDKTPPAPGMQLQLLMTHVSSLQARAEAMRNKHGDLAEDWCAVRVLTPPSEVCKVST